MTVLTHILVKSNLLKVHCLTPLGIVKDVVCADVEPAGDDLGSGLRQSV